MKDWKWHRENLVKRKAMDAEYSMDYLEACVPSPIERIVYMALGDMSNTFFLDGKLGIQHQFKVGPYTADFLISWEKKEIIIECDGHEFHEKTKEQVQKDKKRDRYLTKLGYVVLRYTGSEICSNPYQVCYDIDEIVNGDKAQVEFYMQPSLDYEFDDE